MDSISLEAEYGDLVIHDVQETGVELGRGSYGVVFEVKWRGQVRAAKKLHDFFFEPELRELPGSQKEMMNFKREFRSWVKLDHPNMVHLLGLYYNPARSTRSPIIVMEKMDISLGDYLEKKTRSTFPLQQKACILLQVAEGLSYLHGHTPPLVHHDLKPDNVMLDTNTFTAKLTDFGMIRVTTPGNLARASSMKGTPVFMPPEAKEIPLRYDEQLDVFSFGVVIISTLVHNKAPTPSAARVSQGGRQVAVSELDQRRKYINQFTVEERRLFMPMVGQCLEFVPEMRPRSSQLVDSLSSINASLQSTISPGAAAVHPLTQRMGSLCMEPGSSVEVVPQREAVFWKAEKTHESSPHSAAEMKMLKEKVARLEKQCSKLEEEKQVVEQGHVMLQEMYQKVYIENESLKLQSKGAVSRQNSAELQLANADRAALRKRCQVLLEEKNVLSDNSAELYQKLSDLEYEVKRLREIKARYDTRLSSPSVGQASSAEIGMLQQEVARLEKQCSQAEEERKRHEDCHLVTKAKGSHSEPDHQLVQIDQAALCKKCRKRLQEKKILSANSTVKLFDMEQELLELRAFKDRTLSRQDSSSSSCSSGSAAYSRQLSAPAPRLGTGSAWGY